MKQDVYLIMDEDFGGNLWEWSRQHHVWICNSLNNTPKIKDVWKKERDYSQLKGVTSFDLSKDRVNDFYKWVETIDMHHNGNYPEIDPWNTIFVWGIQIDDISIQVTERCLNAKIDIKNLENHFAINRIT